MLWNTLLPLGITVRIGVRLVDYRENKGSLPTVGVEWKAYTI